MKKMGSLASAFAKITAKDSAKTAKSTKHYADLSAVAMNDGVISKAEAATFDRLRDYGPKDTATIRRKVEGNSWAQKLLTSNNPVFSNVTTENDRYNSLKEASAGYRNGDTFFSDARKRLHDYESGGGTNSHGII